MERAFKIPEWHELHGDFIRYAKNHDKVSDLLVTFVKKHKIKCELVKVYQERKYKKDKGVYYLDTIKIGSKDPKRLKKDKDKFKSALTNTDRDGYAMLRRNGPLFLAWQKVLKDNDNLKVLESPEIRDYFIIDGEKDVGELVKEFHWDIREQSLYLYVRCDIEFKETQDFIEIELDEFYKMKGWNHE